MGCGYVGEVNVSDLSIQVESSVTATRGCGVYVWVRVLCTLYVEEWKWRWKSSLGLHGI